MINIFAKGTAWTAIASLVACSSLPAGQESIGTDGGGMSRGNGSGGVSGSSGSSTSSSGGGGGSSGSGSGSGGSSSGGGGDGGSGRDASLGDGGMNTPMDLTPHIPPPPASCPTIATGMVTVSGHQVQLWAGTKRSGQKGSLLFYWHAAGGNSGEAMSEMGPQINEIVAAGGVVASFTDSTKLGNLNDDIWYTGDFAMSDAILACAVQQLDIDPRRVYAAGCSAGGLMAGTMAYLRSSYVAAAMLNSGGILHPLTLENTHVPAVITAHGSFMNDIDVVYYQATSLDEDLYLAAHGGFEVDCLHAYKHCGAPPELIAAQWTFCKDHPFGVSPEPYASGLPSSLPTYCSVIKAPPDFEAAKKCQSGALCGSGGQVCCYTPGPYGSNYTGESSSCVAAAAQNGTAGRCPTGKLQLCTTSADCSGGQTCDTFAGGYCK